MFYSYRDSVSFCHTRRAHSTATVIKAARLNSIVLCRASLCVKPKSKEALQNDLKRYCISTKYLSWADCMRARLSCQLERQDPQVSRLHVWHVFVKATLHLYSTPHAVDVGPLLGADSSPMRLWGLFDFGKRLSLWNTNRVEIAVCLPDGKMEVGQVAFVSDPHFPPTLRLYSTVWLSWSNIWFVSHT